MTAKKYNKKHRVLDLDARDARRREKSGPRAKKSMFSRLAWRCGTALQSLPSRPAWSALMPTRAPLLQPLQQQQQHRGYIRGAMRPPTTRSSGAPRLKTKSRLGRPSEQRWEMLRNMVRRPVS